MLTYLRRRDNGRTVTTAATLSGPWHAEPRGLVHAGGLTFKALESFGGDEVELAVDWFGRAVVPMRISLTDAVRRNDTVTIYEVVVDPAKEWVQ